MKILFHLIFEEMDISTGSWNLFDWKFEEKVDIKDQIALFNFQNRKKVEINGKFVTPFRYDFPRNRKKRKRKWGPLNI